ncbi:MAG: LacI family DNA-binding transcriptional regulator [Christensenellales bacterium]|jgi:DNA-binding LacI/PurR family transcriptional regulator
MAAIKDVAKLAGVSVGTVSRYLNHPEKLTPQYRERVAKAVAELNYQPSHIAKMMRTKKTRLIALVVPEITNPFYVTLYDAVHSMCEKLQYSPVIFMMETGMQALHFILDGHPANVDGLILGFMDDDEVHSILDKLPPEAPVVLMSANPQNKSLNTVVSDLFHGSYDAAEHLVSLGHRKIAYVLSLDLEANTIEKTSGVRKCFAKHHIELPEEYIFSGPSRYSAGYNAASRFLRLDDPPTAIIAENDILAIGCIKYLNDHNYRVPQDVAVIGYDDIQESSVYSPSVTTVRQPIEDMGKLAVKMLINKIEHPNSQNRQAVFKSKLVVRQSTDANAPVILDL